MFEFDFRTVNRFTPRFNAEGAGGGAPASSDPTPQPQATDPGASNVSDPVVTPPLAPVPTWGMPKDPNRQAPAMVNPILAGDPAPQPAPQPGAPAQPPAPEMIDFGGRKVTVTDPVMKELHKDWNNLQAKATQDSQRAKDLETQLAAANQILQQFTALNQQPPGQGQPPAAPAQAPQAPSQATPEDLEAAKTEFFDTFYENPQAALNKLVENIVKTTVNPVLEPIVQERETQAQERARADAAKAWDDSVTAAAGKFADFNQYVPQMEAVLQNMPGMREAGIDAVYYMAKGMAGQVAPTAEQLAADPQFLEQHVYGNPAIREKFINEYVSDVQTRQAQVPTTMSAQPGGAPPVLPEMQPKTIAEAGKALKKAWGLR